MGIRRIGFFDIDKVLCVCAGIPIAGWAKGEFLSITFNADGFSLAVGAGGDATRSSSKDNSAKIKLRLLHTSPLNAHLMALYKADKLLGRGAFPFLASDLLNLESYVSTATWITKPPEGGFSGEPEIIREWMLETHDLEPIRLLNI